MTTDRDQIHQEAMTTDLDQILLQAKKRRKRAVILYLAVVTAIAILTTVFMHYLGDTCEKHGQKTECTSFTTVEISSRGAAPVTGDTCTCAEKKS